MDRFPGLKQSIICPGLIDLWMDNRQTDRTEWLLVIAEGYIRKCHTMDRFLGLKQSIISPGLIDLWMDNRQTDRTEWLLKVTSSDVGS
jgi:hypothetical protein